MTTATIVSHPATKGFPPIPPLLRWAGGKQRLVKHLQRFVPPDLLDRVYHEPFLGAASLFLHLRPQRALLSDANQHLIDCYQGVRDAPTQIARLLHQHAERDSPTYYYRIRDDYNTRGPSRVRSAQFLYLNRTCFNGIFRVNERGCFNVPYGHKAQPVIPTREHIRQVANALAMTALDYHDYTESLALVQSGHFVYLDPPYPPLNGTSFFQHYTADRFPYEEQEQLADLVHDLDDRGALFMVSLADTSQIRRLYKGFHHHTLNMPRWVSCKTHKVRVDELVITNYEVCSAAS